MKRGRLKIGCGKARSIIVKLLSQGFRVREQETRKANASSMLGHNGLTPTINVADILINRIAQCVSRRRSGENRLCTRGGCMAAASRVEFTTIRPRH